MKRISLCALFLLLASIAFAQTIPDPDLSGKWTVTFNDNSADRATITLNRDAKILTTYDGQYTTPSGSCPLVATSGHLVVIIMTCSKDSGIDFAGGLADGIITGVYTLTVKGDKSKGTFRMERQP
jgi:hypothetical protein